MKRFTDTAIWDKPWFRKLSASEKCALHFIKDKCDNVGVWVTDFESGDYFIGDKIDWESFREKLNNNIVVLENGKWWMIDFCTFQYGFLSDNPKNKIHNSYIDLLKRHKLYSVYKDYARGMDTEQDKDKEQGKGKDQDKDSRTTSEYAKKRVKELEDKWRMPGGKKK